MPVSSEKQGPMDLVYKLNNHAADVDYLIANELLTDAEVHGFKTELYSAETISPIVGAEVEITGHQIVPSFSSINRMSAAPYIDEKSDPVTVRGKYGGFEVLPSVYSKSAPPSPRVVHMVRVDTFCIKPSYDVERIDNRYDFILVSGSEIVPVEPINAHSLRRLYADRAAQHVDMLLCNENNFDKKQIVYALSSYLSSLTIPGDRISFMRTHSLLSYITQLGYFADTFFTAKEFVASNHSSGDTPDLQKGIYYNDEPLLIESDGTLALMLGYRRMQHKKQIRRYGGVRYLKAYEPYLRGATEKGSSVAVPLKNILEIS